MKKTLLPLVAISAMATTGALANSTTDIVELKVMMQQMNKRLAKLEMENRQLKAQVAKKKRAVAHKKKTTHKKHYALTSEKKDRVEALEAKVEKLENQTTVDSKALKLKFSGTHYLHYKHYDDGNNTTDKFGVTRNYLQVKAYFADDPKSYMRVTLDAKQNKNFDKGSLDVRVKYAFLYLDNVLPSTGVELGLVHTPWLDYEEHHGWYYRSIGEAFSEQHNGGHLQTSSDYGINFKTKTEYFSSELGIFNGAGYHGDEDGEGLRGAWRLTGHVLGTGKKHVHKSDTYADVSFFGQYGQDESKVGNADGDYVWYGLHAVYNQPEFLLAAQYVIADKADGSRKGDGWSVNGEYRIADKWNVLARYDDYTLDADIEKKTLIGGITYTYNKYVELIADYQVDQVDGEQDKKTFLFTADVHW